MVNVFAQLLGADGDPEKIYLGSLYVNHDPDGAIRIIAIETGPLRYLTQYETHFDCFDPEVPEVPQSVQIELRGASISGFFLSEGCSVDLEQFEDEWDEIKQTRELQRYDTIVRLAYRLYERAVRGEPAFVGYTDISVHQMLPISDILKLALPLRGRGTGEQRRALWVSWQAEAAEPGNALRRVSLNASVKVSGFPASLVLDVCIRPDGFPRRLDHILGVCDNGRPTVITEDGNVRIGDMSGFFTNVMACTMEQGGSVFVWADHCQSRQVFRITRVETLIDRNSPEGDSGVAAAGPSLLPTPLRG